MPRTTLDLDASVLRQLRRRSRQEAKSMGQVASEVLAEGLSRQTHAAAPNPQVWRTWNAGLPRIDLEDKESVRIALEDRA